MEIGLERVARVARRLFEVDAVVEDLALALVDEDPRAESPPALGRRQLREDQPGVDEAEGFPGEMRVR